MIEEPPEGTYIFLINHQTTIIPSTIKSRCKTLYLSKLNNIDVSNILKKESIISNKNELDFYTNISNGSVGDAIYFLSYDTLKFYKKLCIYLINIKNFNEIDTNNLIQIISEDKNNLSLVFFKLITLLINKVIKKKFLKEKLIIIKEEEALIEYYAKIYNYAKIFYIKDTINNCYKRFIGLNVDLNTTIYSLLIKIHNKAVK